jgi:general secretion pathway protein C
MTNDKIHQTASLLVLLTISAYFSAGIVDAMIGRSLEVASKFILPRQERAALRTNRELSEYTTILERGLFGEGPVPSVGPAPAIETAYTLVGTVEGAVFSGAVLQDSTGQAFYAINRKLPDGSTIIKVMRNKVTLRRSDGTTANIEISDETKIVALRSSGGAGVKKISDGKFMLDQREVLASTENMSQILTQARALPYMENGKTVGFRLDAIVPNSIYAKIGLQNGDVVQKVNSQDIDDPAKFFQLYQGLRNERAISIDLMRGGQRQTLNYEIR